MNKKVWWRQEVIRFQCQSDCFKCCSKPGVVYLTNREVSQAAQYLGISVSRFKSEFLKKQLDLWVIEVEEDLPCPFLAHEGCIIHETKPSQCKTYPFWRENMESKNHWALATAFCPGIGKGLEVDKKEIEKCLKNDGLEL